MILFDNVEKQSPPFEVRDLMKNISPILDEQYLIFGHLEYNRRSICNDYKQIVLYQKDLWLNIKEPLYVLLRRVFRQKWLNISLLWETSLNLTSKHFFLNLPKELKRISYPVVNSFNFGWWPVHEILETLFYVS